MSNTEHDHFWEVFGAIQLVADNGGIAALDSQEAQAIVEGIKGLHTAGAAVIDICDTYFDGEPLGQAIESLAHVIDRTGGESR